MSMKRRTHDVIVIGGGPAGLMAAYRAATRGKNVLLLEKNHQLGKKLSITGGGRCNITNAEFNVRTFLDAYGDAKKFLFSPFSAFNAKDTFTFFEERGLPLKVEERKRAFPKSERASDVTKLLVQEVEKAGVEVRRNVSVKGFVSERGRITGVLTEHGTYTALSFILATGGRSRPETGSTGEGFLWLRRLGHTVHAANPDLVPLALKDTWAKKLQGKTVTDVRVTFTHDSKKLRYDGAILFTHFGVSGPLIVNAAHEVKRLLASGTTLMVLDLFPHMDIGALRAYLLKQLEAHKNRIVRNLLKDSIPPGMIDAIECFCGTELLEKKVHSVTKDERYRLADTLKRLVAEVSGTMGYDFAIVSDGGIDLKEVDMRTMSSKLYSNLFVVGDILHVARPSGGFSLQLAWTTGWVAGSNA